MKKKCAISSWEQLKRGDLIYKVPRFNINEAHGYGEFGRRIKECCEKALIIESNEQLVNIAVDFSNGIVNSVSGTPSSCAHLDSNVFKFIGNPLVRRFIVRWTTDDSLYWNIIVRDDKPSEIVKFNEQEYSVGRSSDLFIHDIYAEECFYTYDYYAYKSMINNVIKEWEHAVHNERREIHSALKKISKIRK